MRREGKGREAKEGRKRRRVGGQGRTGQGRAEQAGEAVGGWLGSIFPADASRVLAFSSPTRPIVLLQRACSGLWCKAGGWRHRRRGEEY